MQECEIIVVKQAVMYLDLFMNFLEQRRRDQTEFFLGKSFSIDYLIPCQFQIKIRTSVRNIIQQRTTFYPSIMTNLQTD